MCVFIYTLSQPCHHAQFQNVCECAVARGAPDADTSSLTLEGPAKFLFDTRRRGDLPAYYTARFPCKKRRAMRPVPTPCARCLKGRPQNIRIPTTAEAAAGAGDALVATAGGAAGSAGSAVGLVVPGSESTSSDMTNGSGASTPRSFWKLAHPVEIV